MKKIIGFIAITVIAITLFVEPNSTNNNSTLSLSNLLTLNIANAECGPPPLCHAVCDANPLYDCILTCGDNSIECDSMYPKSY